MRLLCVIDTLEVGGTETSLLELLSRFTRLEPEVVSLYRGNRLRPAYEAAGIPVRTLELSPAGGALAAVARLRRVIADRRPDLLHASLFRASLAARFVARATRIPLVDTLVTESYSPARIAHFSRLSRAKLGFLKQIDRWSSRWVTRFISNSEASRRANCLALGLAPERVHVVHRGRDPERYRLREGTERAELRKRLGVASDEVLLINVGRLVASKGQRELVTAMSGLASAFPSLRAWIVGEGPGRDELQRAIDAGRLEERVRLLGSRSDVPDLLAAADLFAFPSHYEGFPGALVEAQLSGLPLVLADTPPNREVLITTPDEGGGSALSFTPGDAASLQRALERMLHDLPSRTAAARSQRLAASRRYDPVRIAAEYEDILLAAALARDTTA